MDAITTTTTTPRDDGSVIVSRRTLAQQIADAKAELLAEANRAPTIERRCELRVVGMCTLWDTLADAQPTNAEIATAIFGDVELRELPDDPDARADAVALIASGIAAGMTTFRENRYAKAGDDDAAKKSAENKVGRVKKALCDKLAAQLGVSLNWDDAAQRYRVERVIVVSEAEQKLAAAAKDRESARDKPDAGHTARPEHDAAVLESLDSPVLADDLIRRGGLAESFAELIESYTRAGNHPARLPRELVVELAQQFADTVQRARADARAA